MQWDSYNPAGSKRECITMIRARMGSGYGKGFRVKKVGEISGLPNKDALFLRELWQKPKEDDENDDEQPVSLLDRYDGIQGLTESTVEFYQKNTKKAALAAERGDIERFEGIKNKLVKWTRELLKDFERDERACVSDNEMEED